AVPPLDAGDVRLEQTAPVARALADRNHFVGGQALQALEIDLHLTVRTVTADRELPGLGIDLRNVGEMIAHEERVVGRDRRAEIFDRRLVVRRPVGQFDQWLLARQRVEDGLATGTLRHWPGPNND